LSDSLPFCGKEVARPHHPDAAPYPTWTPPSGKLFRVSSLQGRCRLLAPQMTIYG
jgi:hypothetical protein